VEIKKTTLPLLVREVFHEACAPIFDQMVDSLQQQIVAEVAKPSIRNRCATDSTDASASPPPQASGVQAASPTLASSPRSPQSDVMFDGGSETPFTTISDSQNSMGPCPSDTSTSCGLPTLLGASKNIYASGFEKGKAKQEIPMPAAPVCYHWKTKGWCRYQDKCKFGHPRHKKGIGATTQESTRPQTLQQLSVSPGVPVLAFANYLPITAVQPVLCGQQQVTQVAQHQYVQQMQHLQQLQLQQLHQQQLQTANLQQA